VLSDRVETGPNCGKAVDTRYVSRYIGAMIKRFRHRGLERYFAKGTRAGVQAKHEKRIRLILARLHASMSAQDMDLPGLRLHPLKGNRKGTWAVSVSGNSRITFAFDGADVIDVDYEDYH
jgi:proteic killer suppression protein